MSACIVPMRDGSPCVRRAVAHDRCGAHDKEWRRRRAGVRAAVRFDEPLASVTARLPRSLVARLDVTAGGSGHRSGWIRDAVELRLSALGA